MREPPDNPALRRNHDTAAAIEFAFWTTWGVLTLLPILAPLAWPFTTLWLLDPDLIQPLKIGMALFWRNIADAFYLLVNILTFFVLIESIRQRHTRYQHAYWPCHRPTRITLSAIGVLGTIAGTAWLLGAGTVLKTFNADAADRLPSPTQNAVALSLLLLSLLSLAEAQRARLNKLRNAGTITEAAIAQYLLDRRAPIPVALDDIQDTHAEKHFRDLVGAHRIFGKYLTAYLAEQHPLNECKTDSYEWLWDLLNQDVRYISRWRATSQVSREERVRVWHATLEGLRSSIANGQSIQEVLRKLRPSPLGNRVPTSAEDCCTQYLLPALAGVAYSLRASAKTDLGLFLFDEEYSRQAADHEALVLARDAKFVKLHDHEHAFVQVPLFVTERVLLADDSYERAWNRPGRTYPLLKYFVGDNPPQSPVRRYHRYSQPGIETWVRVADYWSDKKRAEEFYELFNLTAIVSDAIVLTLLDVQAPNIDALDNTIHCLLALREHLPRQGDERDIRTYTAAIARNVALTSRTLPVGSGPRAPVPTGSRDALSRFTDLLKVLDHAAIVQLDINRSFYGKPADGLLVASGDRLRNYERALRERDSFFFKTEPGALRQLWAPVPSIVEDKQPRRWVHPNYVGAILQSIFPVALVLLYGEVISAVRRARPIREPEWGWWFHVALAVWRRDWVGLASSLREVAGEERFAQVPDPDFAAGGYEAVLQAFPTHLYCNPWLWWQSKRLRHGLRANPHDVRLRTAIGIASWYRATTPEQRAVSSEWLRAALAACERPPIRRSCKDAYHQRRWSSTARYFLARTIKPDSFWSSYAYDEWRDLLLSGFRIAMQDYPLMGATPTTVALWMPYEYPSRVQALCDAHRAPQSPAGVRWLRHVVGCNIESFVQTELNHVEHELRMLLQGFPSTLPAQLRNDLDKALRVVLSIRRTDAPDTSSHR